MACVFKDFVVEAAPDAVWDAVRDAGAAHRRLFPGVLRDARLEPGCRVVTFADGSEVRELILDIDDGRRRFAYAAVGGRCTYHHASLQVLPEGGGRSRVLWVTDLLPAEMAAPIAALVEQGARVMQQTLAQQRG